MQALYTSQTKTALSLYVRFLVCANFCWACVRVCVCVSVYTYALILQDINITCVDGFSYVEHTIFKRRRTRSDADKFAKIIQMYIGRSLFMYFLVEFF